MKKIQLKHNIIMYQFPKTEDRYLGQNLFVIYDGDDVVLIDCGYEEHMREVKKEIEGKNIKYVICTHFHPDHVYGIAELGKQNLVGSIYAKETLKIFDKEKEEIMLPDITVDGEKLLQFGGYDIMLTNNKGHSDCGILIQIDDLLFVGDDIILCNDAMKVIPYIAENATQHISALENILRISEGKILIPSHGALLTTNDDIKHDIPLRIKYLEFARDVKKPLSEFETQYNVDFYGKRWHQFNIKHNI